MTSQPGISVVVPAFNAAPWIGETLATVFAQTSPADEVIVVDDGSTDATLAALDPWRDSLTVIRQDNAGCGFAFNTGIRAASSEYVALCPADDLWVPQKLEYQRATLAADPAIDVSFGAAVNFGLSEAPYPRPSRIGRLDRAVLLREMFAANVVPDPSVVVRRDLVLSLGGFVEEVGEDYELWMRAIREGAVFHFDERLLVRLRQHGGNLSAQALSIWSMNKRVHEAAADDIGDPGLAARVLAHDEAVIGRCLLGLGRVDEARTALRRSLRHRLTASALAVWCLVRLPGAKWALERMHRRRTTR
ncbi:MAG TPA: glycosyltransferase [Solirubrobacteraceae bacterium]|nr:glycosyltransferase [Solirubrobacteraceae bacterium]